MMSSNQAALDIKIGQNTTSNEHIQDKGKTDLTDG